MTNRAVIIRTYIRTLLIATGVGLLVTIAVMSAFLLQNGHSATTKMLDSLQDSFVHPTPNTDAWAASSLQGPDTTYVKITFGANGTYYAKHSKTFTAAASTPVFSNLRRVSRYGWFLYADRITKKATYHVWISIDYLLAQLGEIVLAVLLVSALSALLGVLLISKAAEKITRPLTELNTAVLARTKLLTPEPLPVPADPQEIQQLAASFNQLLQALNAQMQQEQRFVADASHELRTPLSVIRGYISLLQRRGAEHPEVLQEALGYLDSESLRLQGLVEALLTLTRNQELVLPLSIIDLTPLITELVVGWKKQANQEVELNLPSSLAVTAHADSLKQILLALLDNAHKYAPDAPITITATQHGRVVELTVADLGAGIPDIAKPHLFERFFRVDAAHSSKIPGNGLGLAIVAQLAHANHAHVAVSDNVPHGSRFILTIPISEESSSSLH
jgi:signal transduction histidine kinase